MLELTGKRLILRDMKLADLPALEHWFQPGREWQKTDGPW